MSRVDFYFNFLTFYTTVQRPWLSTARFHDLLGSTRPPKRRCCGRVMAADVPASPAILAEESGPLKIRATSLVVRPSWKTRHRAALLAPALLRDRLVRQSIPAPGAVLFVSVLGGLAVEFVIIRRVSPAEFPPIDPNSPDLVVSTPTTKVTILPALPPSLTAQPLSSLPHAWGPPTLLVLAGPHGSGRTHAVSFAAGKCDAALLRVTASDVMARSVGRDGICGPLCALVADARAAAPAVLLVDDAQFLLAKDDHDAAAALAAAAEALWEGGKCGVAFVISIAPDKCYMHKRVLELADAVLDIGLIADNDACWAIRVALRSARLSEAEAALADAAGTDLETLLNVTRGATIADVCEAARCVSAAVSQCGTYLTPQETFERITSKIIYQARHSSAVAADGLITVITSHSGSSGGEFGNVGGAEDAVAALREAVIWGTLRRDVYTRLGAGVAAGGVLLYGPPGTGKTLLVREAAQASGAALVAVDASTLARGEVGASERILREIYARALAAAPAIVFFDEVDALFGGSGTANLGRLTTALSLELDAAWTGVVTVCATNRPWQVPSGLLRAGRLERTVLVGLPDSSGRSGLATVYARRLGLDVEEAALLEAWASSPEAEGMSGADLAGACRRAALNGCVKAADVARAFATAGRSIDTFAAGKFSRWRPPP
jgi:SpoVK/Ycf46/Vps4 family AAA+-type ATPase